VKRQDAEEQLYRTAQLQGGFFTARQARLAGYADNTHPHHVRNGNWVREPGYLSTRPVPAGRQA
jgi:hypothetical protein